MKTNLGKDCYFSILGIIELDLLLSNIIKEDSLNAYKVSPLSIPTTKMSTKHFRTEDMGYF